MYTFIAMTGDKVTPLRKNICTLIALAFALVLARGADDAPAKVTYNQVQNIPYYEGDALLLTSYQRERCKLDIYYPHGQKGCPVVVWFHGGGMTSGSKSIPSALQGQGLVIVAANYRLSPQAPCPAYIEDAAAAVAWVFAHCSEYGGSEDRIFLTGHSAGGYLIEMIVLDKQWLATYSIDANRIAGIVPFSGQAVTHMQVRKERGIPVERPLVDEYAPLFHVRGDTPPILLLTGNREKELLGRYEENAYLMRMLRVNGNSNVTLHELQGYGHSMTQPGYPLLLEFIRTIIAKK